MLFRKKTRNTNFDSHFQVIESSDKRWATFSLKPTFPPGPCSTPAPEEIEATRARGLTSLGDLLTDDENDLVSYQLTNVSWSESHFRTILKHLPYQDNDRAMMRAQIRAIKETLERFAIPDKKVTANWISGHCANRYAWWVKLKRYANIS